MSSKEKHTSPKLYYYPCCPISNCNGVLWLKYINEDFSIDYECEKNKDHKGYNIFFETFNRFYLKQKELNNCTKCNSEDVAIKCKTCDKYYCTSCSKYDKHIKQEKDIHFLNIVNENECPLHEETNDFYCIDCNIYLCEQCSEDGKHKGHKIKNIIELIPTQSKLDEMIERLKYYDELLIKIDIYIKEFLTKLKKNIISERNLISNLILNYNQQFVNYTYHLNFEELYNYTKSFNNDFLEKLYSLNSIQEKDIFFKSLIFPKINEPKINDISTYIKLAFDDKIIKLNDNYFLNYNNTNKIIQLLKYDDKKDNFTNIKESKITIKFNIENINIEKYTDQIYKIFIITRNEKILIYECDISKNLIYKIEDEISYQNNDNDNDDDDMEDIPFIKCIELSKNGYIVTSSMNSVSIWAKGNEIKVKGYVEAEIRKYDPNNVKDLILIKDKYFVVALSSKIIFYNIKTLTQEKELIINYSNELKQFYLFNNYIIVKCDNGIGLILIDTMELVQFLEYDNNIVNCVSLCTDKDSIYALYKNKDNNNFGISNKNDINIVEYKIISGILEKVKCYVPSNSSIIKNVNNFEITCLKSKNLLFLGDNCYKMGISRIREYNQEIKKSHVTITGKCVLKKKW